MTLSSVISSAAQSALKRINLLVLDDDVRMAQITKNVLVRLGFQKIHIARDGAAGLRVMHEHPIDIIITDWQMEPMDGINFVRHVRTHPDSPNRYVPIIMLTGQAEAEDVAQARDAGITEFVVKPFTVKRLVERIMLIIDKPRSFILSHRFKGPDRRRRKADPPSGQDRRKRKP